MRNYSLIGNSERGTSPRSQVCASSTLQQELAELEGGSEHGPYPGTTPVSQLPGSEAWNRNLRCTRSGSAHGTTLSVWHPFERVFSPA